MRSITLKIGSCFFFLASVSEAIELSWKTSYLFVLCLTGAFPGFNNSIFFCFFKNNFKKEISVGFHNLLYLFLKWTFQKMLDPYCWTLRVAFLKCTFWLGQCIACKCVVFSHLYRSSVHLANLSGVSSATLPGMKVLTAKSTKRETSCCVTGPMRLSTGRGMPRSVQNAR